MTPSQRAAAERLAAYHAEQADHFSPFGSGNALTIFHGEAAALLRELLAEPQRKPLTDEFVSKVVRSVQPNLSDTCRAWKYEFAQCKHWLDAAHGIGEAP